MPFLDILLYSCLQLCLKCPSITYTLTYASKGMCYLSDVVVYITDFSLVLQHIAWYIYIYIYHVIWCRVWKSLYCILMLGGLDVLRRRHRSLIIQYIRCFNNLKLFLIYFIFFTYSFILYNCNVMRVYFCFQYCWHFGYILLSLKYYIISFIY